MLEAPALRLWVPPAAPLIDFRKLPEKMRQLLMALVVPNNGEGRILNNLTNKVAPQDLDLCLYVNNITPGETDTTATYTEMSTLGYATKNLVAANWTITEGAPSNATAATQTWTFTAGTLVQVYGYFVKQHTSGILMWAERFSDGPYPIQNLNDSIVLTPILTLD